MTSQERIYGNVKMEVGRMLRLPTIQPMADRIAQYVVENFDYKIGQKSTILPHVSLPVIKRVVLKRFGLPFTMMLTPSRKQEYIYPRYVLIYMLYTRTDLGVVAIGRMFKLDHTTIIHARKKISNRMKTEASVREEIDALNKSLNNEAKISIHETATDIIQHSDGESDSGRQEDADAADH